MFPEQYHVGLIAEDLALRQLLRTSLRATGFDLREACSEDEALAAATQNQYDLVLLDFNLPGRGGVEICRRLRSLSPRLGIVMVSAGRDPEDEVRALEAGADDVVTAPFRFREMVARLGAVLRRAHVKNLSKPGVLRAGNLKVDIERRLFWRAGLPIRLSPKEFDLLVVFMKNQGVPMTHLKLLRAVWGMNSRNNPMYLRSYVKALRKKIEEDPADPQYILTEPWVGYIFRDPFGSDLGQSPAADVLR